MGFENEFSRIGTPANLDRIDVRAASAAHPLLLNGEPIGEPVVQYGPFVMNTEREIREAVADLQRGKFGSLED